MKRVITTLLAIIMVLGMCTVAVADGNFNESGFPIAKEPVTYSTIVSQASHMADDWNDYTALKYWSELTNVNFTFEYINSTDWEQQINLRLIADSIPDFIFSPLSTAQIQTFGVEAGKFLNYNDYMEYMPNMANAFEKYPDMKAFGTMLDGGIYSLTQMVWTYTMATPIYYRGDMLAELDAAVPTTVDEFYDLLVAAKEQYSDVEGFYPFISLIDYVHTNLFPAFGDAWQWGYGDNGDGKVSYNTVSDQARYYLEFVAKIYGEGLLDQEMFTMDGGAVNAKVKAGQAFVIGNNGTQLTGEHYASGEIETKVLAPLVSEYTDEQKVYDLAPYSFCGRVISKDCENPEYLLRYFDMFFTEMDEMVEGTCGISSWLGIHGVDWDITEDGENYFRIVPEDTFGLAEEEYKNKYVWGGNYTGLVVLDLFPINNPTQEMKAYESAESYYPYMKYRLMDGNFKYTDDESAELNGMVTDIDTYTKTAIAQFITGSVEINDSTWADFVGTVNSMGLDRVLELKQAGYDRWNGEA